MKVLGLDSALRNTGWQLLEVDPTKLRPHNSPHHTHIIMDRLAGGTIKQDDTDETRLDRLVKNAQETHALVHEHKPDMVVIEGALDKGANRSTTGMALYALIVGPWHPSSVYSTGLHTPSFILTITPERLLSIAYGSRSIKGGDCVNKYRELAKETPKGRVSQHEVDAYFLAYHGVRFYFTCVTEEWPKSILTDKEAAMFYDQGRIVDAKSGRTFSGTPIIKQEGQNWWRGKTQS